ncbi:MAG: metal-dependent hydrolase [Candidatus Liptonbacteria bacterium]|nr:metal-dependent hydrolase [Candidatus Liptonbacteria bacterium]
MDILSHGLWAGAAAKGINIKKEKKINVWLATFWGTFPDLFAFTIPFVWLFGNLTSGNVSFSDIHPPTGDEPERKVFFGNGNARQADSFISYLTSTLYSISHSAVIFFLIIGLVILLKKNFLNKNNGQIVPWEMGGWLLHIFLDVPTHSYAFYPTPVFWPLTEWKFQGFSWANPTFMLFNYLAIIIAYLLIRYFQKRKLL